jgi:hypothetical protein
MELRAVVGDELDSRIQRSRRGFDVALVGAK